MSTNANLKYQTIHTLGVDDGHKKASLRREKPHQASGGLRAAPL
jgi:hypothetical protein